MCGLGGLVRTKKETRQLNIYQSVATHQKHKNLRENNSKFSYTYAISTPALHTAAEPAVRSAVKILVSQRNDTIKAFFFAANKNKNSAQFLWLLLVVYLSIPGLI